MKMMKKLLPVLLLTLVMGMISEQSAEAQILSTKLKITVIDKLGNVVEDAKVTLFKNKADYAKEVNAVQKFKLTNSKGVVTFKKLDAIPYYVLVRKGDLSNAGGGEIVSKLQAGKVNKANVVITDGI